MLVPSLNGYVRFKLGSGGIEESAAEEDEAEVVALVGLVRAVEPTGETIGEIVSTIGAVLFTGDGAILSAYG